MSEEIVKAEPGDAVISTGTGRILLNIKGKLQLLKTGGSKIGTKYKDSPVGSKKQQEAESPTGRVVSETHDTYCVIRIGV